ncbi:MAG: ABC transporter permease [Agathobaculum sp.]|uniref:ABC transporter permease n=1 Tax=Agathobaculum sp. TaxID=2048138 RepID=UPI0025C6BE0B|nr:ABC transporter permease [Agathobaculum sp.]MCI7125721.1 ABC transporter permease [Agathobaculum sp.]MDY3712057.1 ABC transporter permease [Agathobaculum sp.]
MRARDVLRLALLGLRENPLRTGLCALSVAVGTGALLLIASIGLFGQTQVESGLRTLGVSGLTVYLDERGAGNALSAELADAMERAVSDIDTLMPIKAKAGSVRAGHTTENAMFLGADERLGQVMQLEMVAGTLLDAAAAEAARPVAVVGDDLARALYGRDNIVGRQIRVRMDGQDQYFTVCGVVKAQTGALGGALAAIAPHLVYVPYSCLAARQDNADQVFVRCAAEADPSAVSGQITRYLTERGQVDGTVRVQNVSGMVDTVHRLANLCVMLFVAVGSITLCVALIGVLCSMLAAAHEKTGEIGIFLALGAQPRDIRRIFLMQSMLLCALGGLCGLAAAAVLLYGGARLLLPGWTLCAALLAAAVLCGGAAGLLPAVRAARLDPIDAMRK